MQVLSITSQTLEELFSYFLMVLILGFASASIISKNVSNSIMWFFSVAIAVFALLIDKNTSIVSIIAIIAYVAFSTTLLLLETCCNISNNQKQRYSKVSIYTCLCTIVIAFALLTMKFSHSVVDMQNKQYDSTMYIITILFSVIFLITIFGLRVFHDRKI